MATVSAAKRVRVTHITPTPFGRSGVYGGGERYPFELARHMARVTPTTFVTFGARDERSVTPDGLRVRVFGSAYRVRGQLDNPLHIGIARAVTGASIVHVHQTHTLTAELVALLGRVSGRRVFTTDHGGGGWCLASRVSTQKWFCGHLHQSEYRFRIAGGNTDPRHRVILGGVDVETFSPDERVPREPLVVFVGRLMPHKGVDDLIAALPPGLTLELIGRPYHEQYLCRLRELAVGKRVLFRTGCDDAEVVRAYRRAMCVVLPSVYRDCYGNESRVPELLGQTPLEGMACGAAAVVTDVASLPEVVADGVTGFVVPPNHPPALRAKLEWLRDHPDEAKQMGDAGRRRVLDTFTWPAVVARCLAAYSGEPE